MKKILVILGSYFPKPSANGICVREVVRELKRQDVHVDVLATNPGHLREVEDIEGANVYRIKARWFTRIAEYCNANKGAQYSDTVLKLALLLNRVRTILSFPTWPLVSPSYAFRYYQRALALHRMNHYDGVLSVYTPIDALLAGTLLNRKHNSPKLMLYFLDCFSGGPAPRHLTREWMEERGYRWEKYLFSTADKVFVLRSHKEHYSKARYARFRDKIEVVDIPLMRELRPTAAGDNVPFDESVINLVYAGTITKGVRDPSYMLDVLRLLDKSGQYHFHIYGGGSCDILKKYIQEERGVTVIEHGRVDHDTAINAMLKADVLVNIGSAVDTMIPSKIFEYMAAGKPIISFYKHDTEPSIRYLGRYPLALLVEEDSARLHTNAQLIASFIDEQKGKTVQYDEIASVFRDNTPTMLVKSMLEII